MTEPSRVQALTTSSSAGNDEAAKSETMTLLESFGWTPGSILDLGDRPQHRNRALISGSAPDRIRTCDLRFRRPTLYPTELRALALLSRVFGASPANLVHGLPRCRPPAPFDTATMQGGRILGQARSEGGRATPITPARPPVQRPESRRHCRPRPALRQASWARAAQRESRAPGIRSPSGRSQ